MGQTDWLDAGVFWVFGLAEFLEKLGGKTLMEEFPCARIGNNSGGIFAIQSFDDAGTR